MLLDLVPEKRQDKTRDQVSDNLTSRIESGDLTALTQFARFHLGEIWQIELKQSNHRTRYVMSNCQKLDRVFYLDAFQAQDPTAYLPTLALS